MQESLMQSMRNIYLLLFTYIYYHSFIYYLFTLKIFLSCTYNFLLYFFYIEVIICTHMCMIIFIVFYDAFYLQNARTSSVIYIENKDNDDIFMQVFNFPYQHKEHADGWRGFNGAKSPLPVPGTC